MKPNITRIKLLVNITRVILTLVETLFKIHEIVIRFAIMSKASEKLFLAMRDCRVCEKNLEPRPVFHLSPRSQIFIVGQAPGTKVHKSGIPWDDASGERLRSWLGVSKEDFYNTDNFGIMPMGLCYPGKGKSGDLPPRRECAPLWMPPVLKLIKPRLTLLIGQYSQAYFLGEKRKSTLTETVRHWRDYLPEFYVLPHPSPRNNIWLKKNPWFEEEILEALQRDVRSQIETRAVT